MRLARAIRTARDDEPQTSLAARLGRPQSVISNWERGARTPSVDTLVEIEEALDLNLGSLLASAGYVDTATARAIVGSLLTVVTADNLNDGTEIVRAAAVLGFNASLRSVADDDDLRWEVEVSRGVA